MKNVPETIIKNKIYFGGLSIALLISIFFLIFNGKETAFISLNSYHPFYLNVFFINYTFIGDGIFAICLIALMFFYFKKKQCGFALLYSFLISGIATQIIKNLVNSPRPKLYFEAGTYLNFIDGVTLSGSSGFPSGHTATAFAIATVLVLMMKKKNLQLLILLAAFLVGYSRIYLAQHFLLDVLAGSALGVVSGVVSVHLAYSTKGLKFSFNRKHNSKTEPAVLASFN